jgi:hypothetical protein
MPNLSDSCRMVGSPASVRQVAQLENMQFPLSLRTFIAAPNCPFSKCIRIHLKVLTKSDSAPYQHAGPNASGVSDS